MRITYLAFGLLVCLGSVASAQSDGQPASHDEAAASSDGWVETEDGRRYQGPILSDDGESVEIPGPDGSTETIGYNQLTPMTLYRIRNVSAGADVDSQIALADWCVDEMLYPQAKRHYRSALEADVSRAGEVNKSIEKAKAKAAKDLLARANRLRADGHDDEADDMLTSIVQELPLQPAAKKAGELLASQTERRKQTVLQPESARAGDAEGSSAVTDGPPLRSNGEEYSQAAHDTFAPTVKAYHAMLDSTHKGLVESSQGTSIKAFEKGLKEGEKARKETDKVRPQGQENEEVAEALGVVDQKLEDGLVDCRVHLADAYLMRGSDNQALDTINQGLAEYPQNQELLAARSRVIAASSDDGDDDVRGWLIHRRPGRPVQPIAPGRGGGRGRR